MAIDRTKRQRRAELAAAARRVGMVLLLGVVVVASLRVYDYLTTSPRFDVSKVEVRGVTRIDPDEIQDMLSDLQGQNILLAPLDSYKERLEMHPRILHAEMSRVLPNRIRCTVVEREPVALVYTGRFFEIGDDGVVMPNDRYSALLDLPVISGVPDDEVRPGHKCDAPGVQGALDVLRLCKEYGGDFAASISELRVSPEGVEVRTLRDDRVLVVGNGDYEKRLRKYFLLADAIHRSGRHARRVDLRYADQVVLRGSI